MKKKRRRIRYKQEYEQALKRIESIEDRWRACTYYKHEVDSWKDEAMAWINHIENELQLAHAKLPKAHRKTLLQILHEYKKGTT